jgi:hypothetical protein
LGIYPRRISHSKLLCVVMCHTPPAQSVSMVAIADWGSLEGGCYYGKGPMVRATSVYLRLQTEFPGHNALTARPSFVIIVPPILERKYRMQLNHCKLHLQLHKWQFLHRPFMGSWLLLDRNFLVWYFSHLGQLSCQCKWNARIWKVFADGTGKCTIEDPFYTRATLTIEIQNLWLEGNVVMVLLVLIHFILFMPAFFLKWWNIIRKHVLF